MRPITATEHRSSGGVYPSPDWASWRSYRDVVAGPLGEDEALGALVRFPAPAALRRLLREARPVPLHDEGFDAMFAGDLGRIWEWPGVRDFGAVVLLDPWPLSPLRAATHDAYVVDARTPPPFERTIYAPDEECCGAAADAATFAEARARMPTDWRGRVEAALGRVDAYIDEVLSLTRAAATLGALAAAERAAILAEHGLEESDLAGPVFLAPRERRDRLRAFARGRAVMVTPI